MKKKFLVMFLVMILLVAAMPIGYAATDVNGMDNVNLDNYESAISNMLSPFNSGNSDKFGKDKGSVDEKVSGIMKLIMNIITFIPKMLIEALLELINLILPSMDKIIFNDRLSIWGMFFRLSYFDTYHTGLAGEMVNFVSSMYQAFRYIALIGFIVAIAAIAVKLILSSIGKQKAQYKEALKNWLVGLVLLVVGHWLMIYSIYFCDFLITILIKAKDELIGWLTLSSTGIGGIGGDFSLTTAFSAAVGANFMSGAGLPLLIIWCIVAIIAIVIFIGMNLKIAKVYLERVIIVGILIMIFPLVTVFYAFEKSGIKKGSTFESWLRTFVDQVFIQPIHAISLIGVSIALCAMSNMSITAIPVIGMIFVLMVLNTMFTIENIFKRVFAINGASMGSPINPVGAAMSGLGIAAPMLRNGHKAAMDAKANNKGKGKAFLKGAVDPNMFMKGKYGRKNAQMLAGLVGFSLPEEIFNVDKLSQKEQMDTAKRLKKAALTGTITGTQVTNDIRNMENMMDPELVADIKRKCRLGEKGVDQDFAMRKYMQMLADPTVDISGLTEPEFDYYTTSSEDTVKRDLERGSNLTIGKIPANVINARKAYELKHPDQVDGYMRELGLDDAKIKAVEDGTSTDNNDVLAYELLLRKCEGQDIDVNACKNGSNFDADIVHNIDMSDAKMQKRFEGGRQVSRGHVVDPSLVSARKVNMVRNRKNAEKIQSESRLSDATIEAIEGGSSTVSDDDILSYKIMIDRMRTGQDLDTYNDYTGNMSEVIYNGVSMDSATLYSEATTLTSSMPDVINDPNQQEKARSVLAGFRSADEGKLFRCASSVGSNVNINEINNFIDGRGVSSSCDAAAILAVIDQYMIAK